AHPALHRYASTGRRHRLDRGTRTTPPCEMSPTSSSAASGGASTTALLRSLGAVAAELQQEGERLDRAHPIQKDVAVEVIALVLDDAGMESGCGEADPLANAVETLDAHRRPARDHAAQGGHAETPLRVFQADSRHRSSGDRSRRRRTG